MTRVSSQNGTCRSCGAAIVWATSTNGRPTPLDAKTERRIVIGSDDVARVVDTYVSHFTTCPNAAQHRKSKP